MFDPFNVLICPLNVTIRCLLSKLFHYLAEYSSEPATYLRGRAVITDNLVCAELLILEKLRE